MKLNLCVLSAFTLLLGQPSTARAFDDWVQTQDSATGATLVTMELRIHPAPEPQPALSVRLMPDENQRIDGNAAVHYLKAMGFFEQTNAKQKLTEYHLAENERIAKEGLDYSASRPYVWLNMPPSQLPIHEVKQFLTYTSFQPPILREAVLRRSFSGERNMDAQDSPIMYLLPEIQSFREVARIQSLRCRLAIAENRIDDAIEILGQQFAMANHLSQDSFFVSALVGCAIQGIANTDALYVAQHADAPNLYWAFAALPKPLIAMRQAYAFERDFLYQQVKVLREVSEKPRPAGFWIDFVDRLLPQIKDLEVEGLNLTGGDVPADMQRLAFVTLIASAYPGARDYLIEHCDITASQVDAYPATQTVMLAICKLHEELRDASFKWRLINYEDVVSRDGFGQFVKLVGERTSKIGAAASIATSLLPSLDSIWRAENRCQMKTAMAQTVESIRQYAAEHDSVLPTTLDHLALPAPKNAFTGQQLQYELSAGRGILTAKTRNRHYRLILTVAQ